MMHKLPSQYAGFELLASMILIIQPDAKVLYANPAFEGVFGLSLKVLNQISLLDMLGQNSLLLETLTAVSQEGISSAQIEGVLKRPLGQEELPVYVLITQGHTAHELIVEMFPQGQQERFERGERLYEISQVNKEMVRNLAHEIKNPLGGIKGAAQLLQMEVQGQEWEDYTKVIIHETDRLQTLVDRMLEPHRKTQTLEAVNIHEVCERVAALILAEFPIGLEVRRDYDTSIPEFQGDKSQLIQAVLNIARNAAQILQQKIKQKAAVIEFRTRITRQMTYLKKPHKIALELGIIDNGPGIAKEMQERIFFPLVSGKEGGTGLGLTLAQAYIHQHDGLIECVSEPGRTEFKIYIPLVV